MALQRTILAALAVTVLALLLPFGQVAVWDGSFRLTVVLADGDEVDTEALYFATCWTEAEAIYAMETGKDGETPFRRAEKSDRNTYTLSIPCSGRIGPFDIEYSYHQPIWLVVQYAISEPETPPHVKRFPIPIGRGPRVMHIEVP